MIKKFFRKRKSEKEDKKLVEPIFPDSVAETKKVRLKGGEEGQLTLNLGYENYPNKWHFNWCAQVLLKIKKTNENGYATAQENKVLKNVEHKILQFLQLKNTVHKVAELNRKGYRDLIFYMESPQMDKQEAERFFDEVNSFRAINFNLQRDDHWKVVSTLIS